MILFLFRCFFSSWLAFSNLIYFFLVQRFHSCVIHECVTKSLYPRLFEFILYFFFFFCKSFELRENFFSFYCYYFAKKLEFYGITELAVNIRLENNIKRNVIFKFNMSESNDNKTIHPPGPIAVSLLTAMLNACLIHSTQHSTAQHSTRVSVGLFFGIHMYSEFRWKTAIARVLYTKHIWLWLWLYREWYKLFVCGTRAECICILCC